MGFIYYFGAFALGAYLLQVFLGLKQMKHFNQVYQQLRKQGKVAIGRRAGKIRAGTIVMFALDSQGIIIDSVKMQGVTVMAKFKQLPQFCGEDITQLTENHPLVQQENKLVRKTILNARELYLRVQSGNYQEERPLSPLLGLKVQAQLLKAAIQTKLTRSVKQ